MSSFVQSSLYGACQYHTETHDEGDYGSFHFFVPLISYAQKCGLEDHRTLLKFFCDRLLHTSMQESLGTVRPAPLIRLMATTPS